MDQSMEEGGERGKVQHQEAKRERREDIFFFFFFPFHAPKRRESGGNITSSAPPIHTTGALSGPFQSFVVH